VGGLRRARASVTTALAIVALLACAFTRAHASPYVWDDNENRIDDRIETVNLLGISLSFENQDPSNLQRFLVTNGPSGLLYGVFVIYDHTPSASDVLTLTLLGMPVQYRFVSVPAIRSVATFAQIQSLAATPGIDRIEAAPLLYPMNRAGTGAIGVRDPSGSVFPTTAEAGAPQGDGEVVAILDTGINDAPDGSYPGHESLIGRCVGGAVFAGADSSSNTPVTGSVNPVDRGGAATDDHGTHIAGIIAGDGGPSGYAKGVAPHARFADVKVISDLGIGTGVPEALDWCIQNRTRNWGAGPAYTGIDVINLSLSSTDLSDGNDIAAKLATIAAQQGIVVVAAMGNEGHAAYVPSPASGDGVLAVGAFDDQRTPASDDDLWAFFDNYGPRASDGDLNTYDEQKPDLLAPGVAVLSADGSLSSDGAQYHRVSGTSQAAAFVSGAAALLRSAEPSLTPAEIGDLLRATAHRYLSTPPSQGGPDPRWSSTIGFGVIDVYAALLEAQQPQRSQVRRFGLTVEGSSSLLARLWTQREMGATHFVFERAPDQSGAPGAFAPYDSVAATGDGSLLDATNLQAYSRSWPVPALELGTPFWYRVSYSEAGHRYDSPALRFASPVGTSVATIEVEIAHNAYDTDIDASVVLDPLSGAMNSPQSSIVFPLPASSGAVSSEWVSGTSLFGNVKWTFRLEVPAGVADAYLPPNGANPWRLDVHEEGFLNRSGRVTAFRVIDHAPGGDATYEGGPVPQQTAEGFTVSAFVPSPTVGVAPVPGSLATRFGPNPVAAGGRIDFVRARAPDAPLEVFDLSGRRVARAPFHGGAGSYRASWITTDATGQPLPAGLYLARVGREPASRVIVVAR
jgi:hypothetical protein